MLNGYFDYDSIAENLASFLHNRKKVLELCAGTGNLTFHLVEKGFEMVAVDRDFEMKTQFEVKNEYKNIPFHLSDIADMQLDTTFDAIFEHSGSMTIERFSNNSLHLKYQDKEKLVLSLQRIQQHFKEKGLFLLNIEVLDNKKIETADFCYQRFVIEKGKRLHSFFDKQTSTTILILVENSYLSIDEFQEILEKQGFSNFSNTNMFFFCEC